MRDVTASKAGDGGDSRTAVSVKTIYAPGGQLQNLMESEDQGSQL